MDVYEAMRARRTIRAFEPRPVARDALIRALEAGAAAPSNDHMRRWDFVLVSSMERRVELLGKIGDAWSESRIAEWLGGWADDERQRAVYFDAVPIQRKMLLEAPVLVVPVYEESGDVLRPESLGSLNAFASIWCCIENILVAAAAEGLAHTLRIPFEAERPHIKQVLGLPEGKEVPCYLGLGYPAAGARRHEPISRPIESRLHSDSW
jgi:nitroreductase